MTDVWRLADIEAVLPQIDVIGAMARAFEAYSQKRAVVPPVGELLFDDPPGDAHIKYGYIRGDADFVIKIASGFYENPAKGLPANSGLMLIFDAKTGLPKSVLLEEGHLTNVRTAAAGALAAKCLAPAPVRKIGVIGSGVQARMQAAMLKKVTNCRELAVLARDADKARLYVDDMTAEGFSVEIAQSAPALAAQCNLIVLTTPSRSPLLAADDVVPGTHITAMGSDTPEKNELDPQIFARADIVVADSIAQCKERGEINHALRQKTVTLNRVVEIGTLVCDPGLVQRRPNDISVCDLTGVAVQDIEICKAVMAKLGSSESGLPL